LVFQSCLQLQKFDFLPNIFAIFIFLIVFHLFYFLFQYASLNQVIPFFYFYFNESLSLAQVIPFFYFLF
jgi:hypothetical protein